MDFIGYYTGDTAERENDRKELMSMHDKRKAGETQLILSQAITQIDTAESTADHNRVYSTTQEAILRTLQGSDEHDLQRASIALANFKTAIRKWRKEQKKTNS